MSDWLLLLLALSPWLLLGLDSAWKARKRGKAETVDLTRRKSEMADLDRRIRNAELEMAASLAAWEARPRLRIITSDIRQ